jgi:serine O-acetyltransferase
VTTLAPPFSPDARAERAGADETKSASVSGVPESLVARRLDPAARWALGALDRWRSVLTLPLGLAYRLSDARETIDRDVSQWLAVLGCDDGVHGLHSLLYAFGEFRALFYHRLERGNPTGALLARLLRPLFRPTVGLSLLTLDIGPGLFVAHGHATTIAAERIGRNCYVHQGVTIGWDYRGARGPVVGDGVFVGAGAKVLGAVTIGDGARIGANAVVLCDVPPGCTAVGMPARIVEAAAGIGEAAPTGGEAAPSAISEAAPTGIGEVAAGIGVLK